MHNNGAKKDGITHIAPSMNIYAVCAHSWCIFSVRLLPVNGGQNRFKSALQHGKCRLSALAQCLFL
jgi:hypothetical protein